MCNNDTNNEPVNAKKILNAKSEKDLEELCKNRKRYIFDASDSSKRKSRFNDWRKSLDHIYIVKNAHNNSSNKGDTSIFSIDDSTYHLDLLSDMAFEFGRSISKVLAEGQKGVGIHFCVKDHRKGICIASDCQESNNDKIYSLVIEQASMLYISLGDQDDKDIFLTKDDIKDFFGDDCDINIINDIYSGHKMIIGWDYRGVKVNMESIRNSRNNQHPRSLLHYTDFLSNPSLQIVANANSSSKELSRDTFFNKHFLSPFLKEYESDYRELNTIVYWSGMTPRDISSYGYDGEKKEIYSNLMATFWAFRVPEAISEQVIKALKSTILKVRFLMSNVLAHELIKKLEKEKQNAIISARKFEKIKGTLNDLLSLTTQVDEKAHSIRWVINPGTSKLFLNQKYINSIFPADSSGSKFKHCPDGYTIEDASKVVLIIGYYLAGDLVDPDADSDDPDPYAHLKKKFEGENDKTYWSNINTELVDIIKRSIASTDPYKIILAEMWLKSWRDGSLNNEDGSNIRKYQPDEWSSKSTSEIDSFFSNKNKELLEQVKRRFHEVYKTDKYIDEWDILGFIPWSALSRHTNEDTGIFKVKLPGKGSSHFIEFITQFVMEWRLEVYKRTEMPTISCDVHHDKLTMSFEPELLSSAQKLYENINSSIENAVPPTGTSTLIFSKFHNHTDYEIDTTPCSECVNQEKCDNNNDKMIIISNFFGETNFSVLICKKMIRIIKETQ